MKNHVTACIEILKGILDANMELTIIVQIVILDQKMLIQVQKQICIEWQ